MRALKNTERVLNNDAVERLMEKERRLGPSLRFADIADEVAGVYPRVMQQGEAHAGAWSCGMVAGLIDDIPKCDDLVGRIVGQAEEIIVGCLARMICN